LWRRALRNPFSRLFQSQLSVNLAGGGKRRTTVAPSDLSTFEIEVPDLEELERQEKNLENWPSSDDSTNNK